MRWRPFARRVTYMVVIAGAVKAIIGKVSKMMKMKR
jgi:hypothetical protein